MYNLAYCNYWYIVMFGKHTHMIMSTHVMPKSLQFISAATGEYLKNFTSQEKSLVAIGIYYSPDWN